MQFKPLLASKAEVVTFPVYVSVKIDGIRGCVLPELGLVSRKLKPIPNSYIRNLINSNHELLYHDGEILTFTDGKFNDFNTVQSKVMSESGTPDFFYYVFDHFRYPTQAFDARMNFIQPGNPEWRVRRVTQILVRDQAELDDLEAKAIADGWEGLMVRSPNGRYKFGRSTEREGILLKVIRRQRAEALIVDTYERMENENPAELDELGYTKRSSHKDNKYGRGDLGGLDLAWDGVADGKQLVEGPIKFSCGTGFDDETRARFWQIRETLPGKKITFEFRGVGTNGRPRFPAYKAMWEDL